MVAMMKTRSCTGLNVSTFLFRLIPLIFGFLLIMIIVIVLLISTGFSAKNIIIAHFNDVFRHLHVVFIIWSFARLWSVTESIVL